MLEADGLLVRSILSIVAAIAGFGLGFWALHPWAAESLRTDRGRARLASRLVTAFAGAAALGIASWGAGPAPQLPAAIAFALVGTTLSIVDLAEQRLPNGMLLVAVATVGPLLIAGLVVSADWPALLAGAIGAVAMFAVYFLMALISVRAMGMGDVKLAAIVGAMLGAHGISTWLVGLVATFVIGGVAAIIQLARRSASEREGIPFGPFMVAGTLVALAVG